MGTRLMQTMMFMGCLLSFMNLGIEEFRN